MSKKNENIFDLDLFKRLFQYVKPYKLVFYGMLVAVILLAIFTTSIPYITKHVIDNSIAVKDANGFLFYIIFMFVLLILQSTFQLAFIFYAAWLGQNLVKDVRVKLFDHVLKFKMKYFD